MKPGRIGLALIASASLATISNADPKDPPVPAGLDPGGVAVALIGPGIDYTDPKIAARLARDGEGELIGYDLVDGDRRPWHVEAESPPCDPIGCLGSNIAKRLIAGAADATLAPFRAPEQDRTLRAGAIAMVAASPARIVLLVSETGTAPDWTLISAAAERFPDLLFLVSNAGPVSPAADVPSKDLGNVIVVEAENSQTARKIKAGDRLGLADLWVRSPTSPQDSREEDAIGRWCDGGCGPLPPFGENHATTHVAALAVSKLTADPSLKGAALKQRIVADAVPVPDNLPVRPRYGILP